MSIIRSIRIEKIRQLIAVDELKEASQNLIDLLKDSPIIDEAILQSARLHDILRQIRLGLVDDPQANLVKNQIRSGILELLTEIEQITFQFAIQELPFPEPQSYLPRQIFKKQNADKRTTLFSQRESCSLLEELGQAQYMVLLGDAGMGKSTELEWICHGVKKSGRLSPIYKRLSNYQEGQIYLNDLPNLNPKVEDSIILVLDGLDEVDMLLAKKAIEKFKDDHPKVKVLVSCRSNAYAGTLMGFEEYYLGNLAYPEIKQYLQNRLGSFSDTFLDFWLKRNPWNPAQLIDNPFYLVRICEFFEDNGHHLPNSLGDVFEHLIQKSLDSRLQKINHFDDERLRKSCSKSLEKLAFVMECRGENVISKTDLERLIENPNEREVLLAKSSLIEFEKESWRFAHNNFQEYLAAKVLSRAKHFKDIRQAIGVKPNYVRLKWSWTNSLSFLLGLWKDENPLKKRLIDWLSASDIEAIVKIGSFERDKISPSMREYVFRLAFESCKKDDLIVGYRHYKSWELAELGEGANSIRYLFEELKSAKTPTVRNNALLLFSQIEAFKLPDDIKNRLRETLFYNIYDFDKNTSSNRHFALEALSRLFSDLTDEEVTKIVNTFFDSENAQERASAYHFIERQKLQSHFMERLIVRMREIKDHNWQKGKVHLLDEDWRMKNCFEAIDDDETLICFFEKYPTVVKDEFEYAHELPSLMIENLTNRKLSPDGYTRIFGAMKERFAFWLWYHILPQEKQIINFLENNNLGTLFYQFCVNSDKWIGVSVRFLDEKRIEYLVDKFQRSEIKIKLIDQYITWTAVNNPEWLSPLLAKLNRVADEPFEMPILKPQKNHAQLEKESFLAEKALYFNKQRYIDTVNDIFTVFGKEKFEKNEVYQIRRTLREKDDEIYEKYPNSIIWIIDDNFSMTKNELIEKINKNWTFFSISQVKNLLTRKQQEIVKYAELDLAAEEIAVIKAWCDNHLPIIKLNERVTNGDIVFAWFVIQFKFLHYSESLYFSLVDSDLQDHLDLDIIEFIVEHHVLPFQKLKNLILHTMQNKKVDGRRAYSYFKFIEDQRIKEAIPILKYFINHKSEQFDNRDYALRIFISLDGDRDYLFNLFAELTPGAEDYREQTLLYHFFEKPDKAFERILLQKFATSLEPSHKLKYATCLFRIGNLTGLQFLIDYVKQERKSPFDFHEIREAKFENLKGIPLALRLFDYGQDESILQDAFNRVSDVGRHILQNLAICQEQRYFHKVQDAIQSHLKWHKWLSKLPGFLKKWLYVAHPNGLNSLQYLLKDLEFQYYQRQIISVNEAREIWNKLS